MENKVFLEGLPKKDGVGVNKGKLVTDWGKCVNCKIKCLYEGKEYEIEILKYDTTSSKQFTLKYGDNIKSLSRANLHACRIGDLLKIRTADFKLNIGDKINNLVITHRYVKRKNQKPDKYGNIYYKNEKWYRYTCNKCHWTKGEIIEHALIGQGCGCSCCSGKTVVEGINDLLTIRPDLEVYVLDKNEAKNLTVSSHKQIKLICPDCGFEKKSKVMDFTRRGFACSKCSDGISIPEKFFINILQQLELKFKTQYIIDDINKRFDFYLYESNVIMEVHGEQHYKESFSSCGGRTLLDEQQNDEFKMKLALNNGIEKENYIIIDCRKSELEWMKQNVLKSRLGSLFDLSKVNFEQAFEFAINSNMKILVRDLWDNRSKDETTTSIAAKVGLDRCTVVRYLKYWKSIGKSDYNNNNNRVEIFKDGISFGVFDSVVELSNRSLELFKVKLNVKNISAIALGVGKKYKGYTFKYI